MNTKLIRLFVTNWMLWAVSAIAQGPFQNLDFESPILPLVPDSNGRVPILNALPDWSGYLGGIQETTVLYNNRYLGTATLDLLGPGYPSSGIFQGQYTAGLQAGLSPHVPARADASLAQTGMIPSDAQSLRFLAIGQVAVTFDGQQLSLVPLMIGPNFSTLLGADISAFAGETGELRFTAPDLVMFPNDVFLDDISFSPQPVPEPGVFGLFALGFLLLGWRFFSKRR